MSEKPSLHTLPPAVARAHQGQLARKSGYRERALKMFPWVCARCGREFDRSNLQELTVHHRDHDHDNNPSDGSNWELLCLYCHDDEHARFVTERAEVGTVRDSHDAHGTHKPFASLGKLLENARKKE